MASLPGLIEGKEERRKKGGKERRKGGKEGRGREEEKEGRKEVERKGHKIEMGPNWDQITFAMLHFFFFLFRAAPAAYGSSQARG